MNIVANILTNKVTDIVTNIEDEYQPSGEGGARSLPATPHCLQNGGWGMERCLPLGFWAF